MNETVTFELNKIVRDGVLHDMLATGQHPEYRELKGEEKLREQLLKVKEEAAELDHNDPNVLVELQDEVSAIRTYVESRGISWEEFMAAVDARDKERGASSKAYYVGRLTLSSEDPWVEYYRKDPVKYKEVE